MSYYGELCCVVSSGLDKSDRKNWPKVSRWLCRNGKSCKESARSVNMNAMRKLEAMEGGC